MLRLDQDALVCDLAETYGILDWRSLPVSTLATLASGLRDSARIMMRLSGSRLDLHTMMEASSLDALRLLWWAQTKDGQAGRNAPKSVLQSILGEQGSSSELEIYNTGDDFHAAWNRLTKEG